MASQTNSRSLLKPLPQHTQIIQNEAQDTAGTQELLEWQNQILFIEAKQKENSTTMQGRSPIVLRSTAINNTKQGTTEPQSANMSKTKKDLIFNLLDTIYQECLQYGKLAKKTSLPSTIIQKGEETINLIKEIINKNEIESKSTQDSITQTDEVNSELPRDDNPIATAITWKEEMNIINNKLDQILQYQNKTIESKNDHTAKQIINQETEPQPKQIIIKPKDNKTITTLREELRNKPIDIPITTIITRQNHIKIGCENHNDLNQLKEVLEKENLNIEEAKTTIKLIAINVPTRTEEEFFKQTISNITNKPIDQFSITAKKLNYNKDNLQHITFELDRLAAIDLIRRKTIRIGFQTIHIKKFRRILRCKRCQSLEHPTSACKSANPYCEHCGYEHESEKCKNNSNPYCINCDENNHKGHNHDPRHKASSNECPSFKLKYLYKPNPN